ncbi:uncharacterized protein PHACADRAFT_258231 [Phanerochaete carnosa HHB-10118-sp]|uniref:Uncharacterized protein n=1 Tax=Phanerochaete carnosa (strain HHB-10118-sp) TaxID=650164 RepID=K5W5J9_PHACS|nr:uncharacterized protein PHACADRAFT_258231 [Phanerochaete carnosa HHB-10118-sp]EKM54405.1 hypothetical protein PHACADRAFT_258231 [Phanerochaete carnosa HHB-10118-sp]
MRAIDDGSRRPSLPTNTYIPYVSTDSSNAVASSPRTPLELSPGGSSASESAYDDSEVDQDETELAEFDTDVELDLPHGPGTTAIHDPPVSDTASQHTFGGGSFNHYSSGFMHASSIPSVLDDDDDMDSTSPVSFAPDPEDEQFDDGDRPLPSLPAQRKASLPWEIPSAPLRDSASGVTRGREDSAATVTARRASRSVDDDLTASTMYPDVQVATAVSLRSAEFDDQALSQPTPSEEQEYQYGEYNLDYILGGGRENWSRKSWSSGAPSYIQARRSDEAGDPGGLGAAWDAAFHRRPSTATVNSGEDAFTRHVRDWDSLYNTRRIEWSFRPESTDGRGPHRMPLTPTTSENRHQNMQPGAQELWRQAYVGRFKVDRVKMNPDHPPKAPQQRLNVRHVTDPFSKGNKLGGPGSVIHKHSRAIAFSIFRNHSLFSRSHRQHKQPMHTSISILLANKKVQEQYTSTRTTSRLNSHGLLEDVGTIETSTSFSQTRTMVSSAISARSRPGTPHAPADGSQSEGYVSDQRGQCSTTRGGSAPAESSSSRSPTLPPSVPPPTQSNMSSHSSALSSSSIDASEMIRVSGDSFSQGEASTMADRNSTLVGQSVTTITSRSRRNSLDVDDEDSPPRTSHAEAFATVDSSYFERTRTDRRMEEPSSHGLVQSLRRKLLGSSKGSSKSPQSTMPPALPREGNYTPPWLTMAPRSKQEERERVIQNLNESFKDVGLLPTARISNKASSSKGKRSRHPNVTTIFENVPADSLYMLLPLWPGDTDPASENGEDPASSFVPVEERQYLLVYYVPFEEKIEEKKSDQKKRARADTRSIATASSMTLNDRDRIISLRCFKAVARLVSYIDLRETGVRVPSFGLSVTGSLKEATRYLPPPSIREEKLDDIAIGSCMGRERGVEFYPEGLQKLGLCMPTLNPPRQPTSETDVVEEEEVLLTPIGRAAVEMAWLGCMAVTSFTST